MVRDELPLHNYNEVNYDEYAKLKFEPSKERPLPFNHPYIDPFKNKGKSYGGIIANNVVSAMQTVGEIGSLLGMNPSHYYLLNKNKADLDPEYNDAVEQLTRTIKEDPHGFVVAAANGLADEWDKFTEDEPLYLYNTAKNFATNLTESAKRLFTESVYDCARKNNIDIKNATDEEVTFCRSQAIIDGLTVSEVIPGSIALKQTAEGAYNIGKFAGTVGLNELETFVKNNFDDLDGGLQPAFVTVGSTHSKVNNNLTTPKWKDYINNIFLPVIGETGKPIGTGSTVFGAESLKALTDKDPHMKGLKYFGWGSRNTYGSARKELEKIYKEIIIPEMKKNGQEGFITNDLMNDLHFVEPETALQVQRILAQNWQRYGWMPGKNNILFTEIDDRAARLNYPLDEVGETTNIKSLNRILMDGYKYGFEYRLDEILDHDILYKHVPDFKNIKIRFMPKDEGELPKAYLGSWQSNSNVITLNLNKLLATPEDREFILDGNKNPSDRILTPASQDSILSTLLHEVQHAMQEKVNYIGKGNHQYWIEKFNNHRIRQVGGVQNLLNTYSKRSNEIQLNEKGENILDGSVIPSKFYMQFYPNGDYDIITDLSKVSPSAYPQLAKTNLKPIEIDIPTAKIFAKKLEFDLKNKMGYKENELFNVRKLRAKNNKLNIVDNPKEYLMSLDVGNIDLDLKNFLSYYNLFHEVESRNVQARQKLDYEARKVIPPIVSQDLIEKYGVEYKYGDDAEQFLKAGTIPYSNRYSDGSPAPGMKGQNPNYSPVFADVPNSVRNRISLFEILSNDGFNINSINDISFIQKNNNIPTSIKTNFRNNVKSLSNFREQLIKELTQSDLYKEILDHKKIGASNPFGQSMAELQKELEQQTMTLMEKLADTIMFSDMTPEMIAGLTRIKPNHVFPDGGGMPFIIGKGFGHQATTDEKFTYLNDFVANADEGSKVQKDFKFLSKSRESNKNNENPLNETLVFIDKQTAKTNPDLNLTYDDNVKGLRVDSSLGETVIINGDFLLEKFERMGIGNINYLIKEAQGYYLAKLATRAMQDRETLYNLIDEEDLKRFVKAYNSGSEDRDKIEDEIRKKFEERYNQTDPSGKAKHYITTDIRYNEFEEIIEEAIAMRLPKEFFKGTEFPEGTYSNIKFGQQGGQSINVLREDGTLKQYEDYTPEELSLIISQIRKEKKNIGAKIVGYTDVDAKYVSGDGKIIQGPGMAINTGDALKYNKVSGEN